MQPDSTVLVAVMNSLRDFEIARTASWYRVPQRSAPKFFPPEFVAFYFTKPFGADAYSVRWYAQARGHELVTRRDLLPDEPDHPHSAHVYYKVQLGPLLELPHPIPSKHSPRRNTILLIPLTSLQQTPKVALNDAMPRYQDGHHEHGYPESGKTS